MKKLLYTIAFATLSGISYSQTIIYSDDFENGGTNMQLNTADLGGTYTTNSWVVNNSYTGGFGTFPCVLPPPFPTLDVPFVIPSTVVQPAGISNGPTSNYLHISNNFALAAGIMGAGFGASDGTCISDESNFAKMTNDFSTSGMSAVSLSFWWLCGGGDNIYGEIYYSTNSGSSWTLLTAPISQYKNQTSWAQQTITNAAFDNQATLRFGYRFVNNNSSNVTDPGFCLDDIVVSTVCNATAGSASLSGCAPVVSPSGNYQWTSSNTYMDTITNAAGCDSVLTVNVTITPNSTSSAFVTACNSYTSPSGNYVWTTSNTYTDTVPNTIGCDSIITITLMVNTLSNATTNTSTSITATQTSALYRWLDCDNGYAEINGAYSQTFNPTSNGNYAVEVTKSGCIDTSACVSMTTLGMMENDFGAALAIFPNPTKGDVTVSLGSSYENVEVRILDLSGREISRSVFGTTDGFTIELKGQTGYYLLEIQTANSRSARLKVFKE